jgi:aspartyl/asparaginyl beta-hydroxylase
MQVVNNADAICDRIRLPFIFDVTKMQNEIQELNLGDFIYYDSLPLRAPAHLVDTSLPFPPPAEDFADGSWTEWLDTPILKKSPYLTEVVDTFRQHTKVTLVRLLRLAPGAVVKEHTDPTLGIQIEKSVIRLTIPILTNDTVEFFLNGTTVPMQAGECWYLRLTDPHRINNAGATERINLTIDMIPNDWVRSMILNEEEA